jgi:two-component system phosphate regulon response regulator PhoB
VWVDGEEVALTALELRLLMMLYDRRGRVLSRDLLLDEVWGAHVDVTARNVDTHVKRVREKLSAAGDYIETVRGAGYRFRAEPDGA